MITGKLYDQLKFIAQIFLPALGTLYFALAGIWNLPSAEQIVGTIMAFDAFLGVLLGISQSNYSKHVAQGTMLATPKGDGMNYSMEFDEHPLEDLAHKKELRLKVKKTKEGTGTHH